MQIGSQKLSENDQCIFAVFLLVVRVKENELEIGELWGEGVTFWDGGNNLAKAVHHLAKAVHH